MENTAKYLCWTELNSLIYHIFFCFSVLFVCSFFYVAGSKLLFNFFSQRINMANISTSRDWIGGNIKHIFLVHQIKSIVGLLPLLVLSVVFTSCSIYHLPDAWPLYTTVWHQRLPLISPSYSVQRIFVLLFAQ